MLGGGWRQAGLLAAAALHALDHHVGRLADDHANAARLAEGLRALPGLGVDGPHTNMVFVRLPPARRDLLTRRLAAQRIVLPAGSGDRIRLVTHLDIDRAGIERTIAAFAAALAT
jgi:threonine aldolase